MPSKSKNKTKSSVITENIDIVLESSTPKEPLTKGKEDASKPLYLKRI